MKFWDYKFVVLQILSLTKCFFIPENIHDKFVRMQIIPNFVSIIGMDLVHYVQPKEEEATRHGRVLANECTH